MYIERASSIRRHTIRKSRLHVYANDSLIRLDALELGIQKQDHLVLQGGLLLGPT